MVSESMRTRFAPGKASRSACSIRSVPRAGVGVGREAALRAGVGRGLAEIAEMAEQPRRVAMEGERDAAVRAHLDMAALRALQRGGVAAPVEEDDRLLVAVEPRLDRLDQPRRDEDRRGGLVRFLRGGADVEHMHSRAAARSSARPRSSASRYLPSRAWWNDSSEGVAEPSTTGTRSRWPRMTATSRAW